MIRLMTASEQPALSIWVHSGARIAARLPELTAFAMTGDAVPLSRHPAWLNILHDGLGHDVYAIDDTFANDYHIDVSKAFRGM